MRQGIEKFEKILYSILTLISIGLCIIFLYKYEELCYIILTILYLLLYPLIALIFEAYKEAKYLDYNMNRFFPLCSVIMILCGTILLYVKLNFFEGKYIWVFYVLDFIFFILPICLYAYLVKTKNGNSNGSRIIRNK